MIIVELRSSIFPPKNSGFCVNSQVERTKQISNGMIHFIELLTKSAKGKDIDIYFSDNTVESLDLLPEEIFKLIENNSIKSMCANKNDYGYINKGAGLVEMWKHNMELIKKYDWLLYFETRTDLTSDKFLRECLSRNSNVFKILNPEENPHFYTGLFMVRTEILDDFCKATDPNEMLNSNTSIEYLLKDFMDERYPDYIIYKEKLNVIWHDVTQNRFIEF